MSTSGRGDAPIACFSHVQKAGGTTVEAVMRRHFGVRHMLVNPPRGWIYRKKDLAADLRLNPWARSIGGHWLRPFVDFGEFEDRLAWYIFLREPVSRFLSHYQYHVEHMGVTAPFEQWMEQPIQHNWQTQFLAGEQDVEAAKQILASRYRAIGLLERFDESLLLVRQALGLNGLDPWYGRPHNPAQSGEKRRSIAERYREQCVERNQLDLELYRFARDELYPRQVAEYGEERLRKEVASEFAGRDGEHGTPVRSSRELGYLLFRRAVHLPVGRVRSGIAKMRGVPDERR
ncbi:MAG TPA: sulfotransferase family 2 domain-containing protein [Longimicrobiaceae bacterium]|nr:sulfotransferase family 2 domain-containing protein [Longimicrobiaceae bacterium]